MECCDLLIVGAGAAGISAAVSAWEHGVHSIVLVDSEPVPGGILPQCSHKGFGLTVFGTEKSGPDYVSFLMSRLSETGVDLMLRTEVLSVSPARKALLSSRAGLQELCFQRMILASGCRERSIGSLPVAGTRPAGIFTAGQVQALLNLRGRLPGREILILGSGDLGMIIANQLNQAGAHVIAVVEQNSRFGGLPRNYHRFLQPSGIPLLLQTTVGEIFGRARIEGVTLFSTAGEEASTVCCDTLITAVGLIPDQALIRGLNDPDWLYLAGNCCRVHDLVDSAVSQAVFMGREAALSLTGR